MTASTSMPNRKLQTLDVLPGTRDMHATIGGQSMWRSTATFAWHAGHGYLTMRVDLPAEIAPEWQANSPLPIDAAIGLDDHTGGFAMLYADARGVCRIYQMAFDGTHWSMLGQAAPGFHQRFEAVIDRVNGTITGCWDHSADAVTWKPDFEVTYTKRAAA